MNDEKKIRLSKLMADKGICSRREADAYIEKGLVFVNGERITQLGFKVSPDVRVTLDAPALKQQKELVTIMLHKPVGYVSSQPEPPYEPAIKLIKPENQFLSNTEEKPLRPDYFDKIAVVGRLDIDSTGLLLFTQDGRIAKKIIGENSEIEKEYLVRVQGQLPKDKLALLNYGLELDGQKLKPAKVEWLNENQLRFVLTEGKKRQIRRMCDLVGLKVLGLKRVRIGKLRLGPLPEGKWRFVEKSEL